MFDVVAPVLHEYVNGPVPLITVAVNVAGNVFVHTVRELTVTFGLGLTVNVPEPEPMQPL